MMGTLIDGSTAWYWKGGKRLLKAGYGADYVHTGYDNLIKAMLAVCPYGQVGDRLWVKETWAYPLDYNAPDLKPKTTQVLYKADSNILAQGNKWRSSRFMPRWASRILLEIDRIRVETLQEIENHPEDYKAEGYQPFIYTNANGVRKELSSNLIWFSMLWDSLNTKCGFPWESNPWVWVIDFKVVKDEQNP
jgi:hypothetical protein